MGPRRRILTHPNLLKLYQFLLVVIIIKASFTLKSVLLQRTNYMVILPLRPDLTGLSPPLLLDISEWELYWSTHVLGWTMFPSTQGSCCSLFQEHFSNPLSLLISTHYSDPTRKQKSGTSSCLDHHCVKQCLTHNRHWVNSGWVS